MRCARPGLIAMLLLLAGGPLRAELTVPWKYHWRDIFGQCLSDCDNKTYRCPCQIWTVPMPK
jgi:hypothetical protein